MRHLAAFTFYKTLCINHIHFTLVHGFRRQPGKRVADKFMPPILAGAGSALIFSPDQAKVWPKAPPSRTLFKVFATAKNRTRPVELRAAAVITGLTNTDFLRPPAGFIWVGAVRWWSGVQRTSWPGLPRLPACLLGFSPAFGVSTLRATKNREKPQALSRAFGHTLT